MQQDYEGEGKARQNHTGDEKPQHDPTRLKQPSSDQPDNGHQRSHDRKLREWEYGHPAGMTQQRLARSNLKETLDEEEFLRPRKRLLELFG